MAGRPRLPNRAQLERCPVPDPPPEFSAGEKAMWAMLAAQVNELGTYDRACYTAFRQMAKVCAAVEQIDMTDVDTPATRLLTTANQLLSRFGLTPADRHKVSSAPLRASNPDDEFSGEERA